MTRGVNGLIAFLLCVFFVCSLTGIAYADAKKSVPSQGNLTTSTQISPLTTKAAAPSTNATTTTSTEADEDDDEESAVKLEKQRIELEEAKLGLEEKRREASQAAETAELEMRQKRIAAEKAEIELRDARRESAETALKQEVLPIYQFWGEVSEDSCKDAIAKLDKLDRRFPGQPLTIILNTPGGDVTSGLALYDHIQSLRTRKKHHITIIVHGWAASMGGILLQAADKRIVGAQCQVLIHEVRSASFGKLGDMQDDMENLKVLWVQLSKILARRARMTDAQIRERAFKRDWWLSAEEAVKLGFADEIE